MQITGILVVDIVLIFLIISSLPVVIPALIILVPTAVLTALALVVVIWTAMLYVAWQVWLAIGDDWLLFWGFLVSVLQVFSNCSSENLLGLQDQLAINELMGTSNSYRLLYRGCRDGWDAEDFHDKVDNQGATVTLVRIKGGNVIGGYTDIPWADSGGAETRNGKSFLFYKKNYQYTKLAFNQQDEVTHSSSYLAAFGSGPPDVAILPDCNSNERSYVRLNDVDYVYPPGAYSGRTANEQFTGRDSGWEKAYFECVDIDVYKVV